MILIADNLEEFYQSYFEDMAVEYCEHRKGASKPHFYVNNFIDSLSEVNEAVRSKLSPEGVSMILDMFDDDVEMNDALPGMISGAFSIVAKFDPRDPLSLRKTRQLCRGVARKVLMNMRRDSYVAIDEERPLAQNYIEVVGSAQGIRLGVVGDTFSGWAYTFNWRYPEDLFFGV
jgi:hypothetical protein